VDAAIRTSTMDSSRGPRSCSASQAVRSAPDGVDLGHDAGLRVHAGQRESISTAVELPWRAPHRAPAPGVADGAAGYRSELAKVDEEAGIVGKLARWTRAQSEASRALRLASASGGGDAPRGPSSRHGSTLSRRWRALRLRPATRSDRFDYSRFAIGEFRALMRPSSRQRSAAISTFAQQLMCSRIRTRCPTTGRAFASRG
jgi:hypothetical protein